MDLELFSDVEFFDLELFDLELFSDVAELLELFDLELFPELELTPKELIASITSSVEDSKSRVEIKWIDKLRVQAIVNSKQVVYIDFSDQNNSSTYRNSISFYHFYVV
uniref:Uncharacterized protein n=1 Tax=Marseillevirus LCMAC101 TaxID=2506602 RepID=A0A481YRE8_9VIRU|nr:MAG: hypothetical protein LCMAC101_00840 [Marseillevirus LCMAC101]